MRLILRLTFSLSVIILILSFFLFTIFKNFQNNMLFNIAKTRAKTLFDMIVLTRQWVADNRQKVKPVPAVVTKELSNYAKNFSNFSFHITSDRLINPENAPDDFEKKAIVFFKKGGREFFAFTKDKDGETVFKYMAPLYIKETCLKCHYYQGYKVGDFRGGISITIPVKDLEHYVKKSSFFLTTSVSVLYIAVIFSIILLVYYYVMKPILLIKEAADRIESGDLKVRLDFDFDNEIGELSRSFNSMVEKLEKSEEILKNRIKTLSEKYNVVIRELKEQSIKLRKVNEFKGEILDLIAHEIRTPITKVVSYAEMLSKKEVMDNKALYEKMIKTIQRNAKVLNDLLDNILVMTKVDSDYTLSLIPVDICRMFDDIAQKFKEDIDNKKITLEIVCVEGLTACVDVEIFPYVLINLMSNAIKFNVEGGLIRLEAMKRDNGVFFSVYNTGVGIEKSNINRIFKRFFRGKGKADKMEGVGLGLSIVARIVKRHNGEIKVESEAGKWAKFTIFLPDSKK